MRNIFITKKYFPTYFLADVVIVLSIVLIIRQFII
jgi:lipoprotein signal peptidase